MTSNTGSGGVSGQYPNQGAYQEIVVQTKALPAEIGAGGVSVNMITKDGGNRFRGDLFGTFTNNSLQADNVSDEQRERGLIAPSATDVFYDLNAGVGGPIVRDRLWFSRQRPALPRRSLRGQHVQSRRIAGARREPDLEHDGQADVADQPGQPALGFRGLQLQDPRPSPADHGGLPVRVAGGQLLLAAVGTGEQHQAHLDAAAQPAARRRLLLVLRALVARLPARPGPPMPCRAWTSRARRSPARRRRRWCGPTRSGAPGARSPRGCPAGAASTRSKAACSSQHAPYGQIFDSLGHGDLVARYRNGVPDSVTVYNTPVATSLDQFELGVFVQDSWTITRRLTLNAGLRYERHVGSLERAVGAGRASSCRRARSRAVQAGRLEHRRAAPGGGLRPHRRGTHGASRPAPASTRSARARQLDRPVQPAAAEHREPHVERRQRRPDSAARRDRARPGRARPRRDRAHRSQR